MVRVMQPLIEWLMRNERSAAWLARRLEVSRETVSAWLAGEYSPSMARAQQIEEVTEGAIKAADLVRRVKGTA